MASATQSGLIQRLAAEEPSGASRQFGDTQPKSIVCPDEETELVIAAKRGDGLAFEILNVTSDGF
jgi:hypothetical protein